MPSEAPLVALINTDVKTLTREQLEEYLRTIRELRSSPQTARAKTERKPRKSSNVGFDPSSML